MESIVCWCFLAGMGSRTDSVLIGGPAITAGVALTALAKLQSETPRAKELTTYVSTARVAILAIQTPLHRHGILFLFLLPRLAKAVVEKIPERPDIELLFAPRGRILVFVLKGSMEPRRHVVAGAIIADPG